MGCDVLRLVGLAQEGQDRIADRLWPPAAGRRLTRCRHAGHGTRPSGGHVEPLADPGGLPGADQRIHPAPHGATRRTGVPDDFADAPEGGQERQDHAAETGMVADPLLRAGDCPVAAVADLGRGARLHQLADGLVGVPGIAADDPPDLGPAFRTRRQAGQHLPREVAPGPGGWRQSGRQRRGNVRPGGRQLGGCAHGGFPVVCHTSDRDTRRKRSRLSRAPIAVMVRPVPRGGSRRWAGSPRPWRRRRTPSAAGGWCPAD